MQFAVNGRQEELKLHLDDNIGCQRDILGSLRAGQIYSPDVTDVILKVLKPGDTFVDIGANMGFFSILGSKLVGDEGHVVAFEANTENHAALLQHTKLNLLRNIETVCKPIADKSEVRLFFDNADDAGGHALWNPANLPRNLKSNERPSAKPVETITLDDFFFEADNLPSPKVIKIDIEGAEELAVRGARKLLNGTKVPYVICELHEFGLAQLGGSQTSLREFMGNLGYEMFSLAMDGSLPKLIPKGVQLHSNFILNVLFTRPEYLARYWPHETFDNDERSS